MCYLGKTFDELTALTDCAGFGAILIRCDNMAQVLNFLADEMAFTCLNLRQNIESLDGCDTVGHQKFLKKSRISSR